MIGLLLLLGDAGSLSFDGFNFYTIIFVIFYVTVRGTTQTPSGLALTMAADISDYETSVSGRYVSGMLSTIFSLTDSIASSMAPMIIGFVLAL